VADAVAESGLGTLKDKLAALEAQRTRLQEERAAVADRAVMKQYSVGGAKLASPRGFEPRLPP
jgi:hypothetical protein